MYNKSRNWCFTLNNPDMGRRELINKLGNIKYCVIGTEIGSECGTKHYQGYVDFENPRALGGLKKIDKRIHWEERKGTWTQAVDYCKKDGVFIEHGDPNAQGNRTDIESITRGVIEGKSDRELLLEHGDKALRMMNHISKARAVMRQEKRNWEMDVRIYCGPPNTGKTKAVYDEFKVDDIYPKMSGKWWDGYNGEKCVLIDDFDPKDNFGNSFDFYLKLLDRYPMMIEWKGGSGYFYSRTIIFTSNFHWDDWFTDRKNRDAFFRRVTIFREFREEGDVDAWALRGSE